MEALAIPEAEEAVSEEAIEVSQWGVPPPPNFEEEELDLIAFKLWQRVSCVEDSEQTVSDSTEAALCHSAGL